ncbi:MAG TPA: hypothetical protein PK286_13035 [Devosia sp.]|nr:hypothetical protein [Devosia sp.]
MTMPSAALGYCSDPSAPSFYGSKPIAPSKPYCINSYTNTHTCSDWEVSSYNSDIDRYNDALRQYQWDVDRYVDELKSYIDEAVEYAECEIRAL